MNNDKSGRGADPTPSAADVAVWKKLAIRAWAETAISRNDDELRESGAMRYASMLEMERMKSTISWRITAPLRAVRGRLR